MGPGQKNHQKLPESPKCRCGPARFTPLRGGRDPALSGQRRQPQLQSPFAAAGFPAAVFFAWRRREPARRRRPSAGIFLQLLTLLASLILFVNGVHNNPGPRSSSSPLPSFIQWNCNGLHNKVDNLRDLIVDRRISIVALQESKLKTDSRISFPGYNLVSRPRPSGGGGRGGVLGT